MKYRIRVSFLLQLWHPFLFVAVPLFFRLAAFLLAFQLLLIQICLPYFLVHQLKLTFFQQQQPNQAFQFLQHHLLCVPQLFLFHQARLISSQQLLHHQLFYQRLYRLSFLQSVRQVSSQHLCQPSQLQRLWHQQLWRLFSRQAKLIFSQHLCQPRQLQRLQPQQL